MIHQTVSSENLSAFSTNRPINNGPRTCGDLLLMATPLSPREILRNFPLPPQGGRREPVPLTQVAGRLDALEVGGFRDLRRRPVGAPYIETSKDEIVNQYELMMMRMIEDDDDGDDDDEEEEEEEDEDGNDDEDEDEDGFGCVNYFDVNLCGQVGGGQTQQHGSLFGL